MMVNFSEPPNSPDNLTILSVTSRTARVSWSISRAEPKIERFVVQWKRQHGKQKSTFNGTLFRKAEFELRLTDFIYLIYQCSPI